MYYSPEYNNLQRGLLGFLTENDLILFQIVVAKSFDQIMQTRMLLSQIQDKMNDIAYEQEVCNCSNFFKIL
jgi:hypothetical protein